MAVTGIEKDYDALTLRLTAEFAAPIEAVWQLWADPRKLERWWGPPQWPATFVQHELSAGGSMSYYMTGPDGTKAGGWWRVESVDPPTSIIHRRVCGCGWQPHRLTARDAIADGTQRGEWQDGDEAQQPIRLPRSDGDPALDGVGGRNRGGSRPDGCPARVMRRG